MAFTQSLGHIIKHNSMMEESKNIDKKNKDGVVNSSLDEKIVLLENQIHLINSKLHEPEKKSWFIKNASLLISIIALSTSITFSFYGIRKEMRQEKEKKEDASQLSRTQKAKKIEELTLHLTQLIEKNTKLAAENPNVNVNTLSVLLNYQRLIYVNEIMELITDFDEYFPPDIYALIGNELRNDGQFQKALEFYYQELKSTKTFTSKVVAYRDLGQIYGMKNTQIHNPDSNNYYRNLSIQFSDSIHGEQKYNYKGYSYQLWAADEFYLGNSKFALQLIDSARNQYLNLPDNNNAKNYNIKMLGQMLEFENRKNLIKIFVNLSGEWGSSSKSTTRANLHFYQNSNGWICSLEIYESGKVTHNLTGSLISMSDSHMTFSLQGMKKIFIPGFPTNDRTSSSATMRITKSDSNDNLLYVTLNEMNSEPLGFNVYKK